MNDNSYTLHKISIFALFMLGDAGITIPYSNGNDKTLIGFLLALILGSAILVLYTVIIKKFVNKNQNGVKKYLSAVIFLGVAIFTIFIAAGCFNSFLSFAESYILPNISDFAVGLVFAAVVSILCLSKTEVFYKLGLISALISALLLIILFLFSLPQFDDDKIILSSFPDVGDVWKQTVTYLLHTLSPLLILPFFELVFTGTEEKKPLLGGYISGAAFLCICILNSLLIFGNELSARLDFPYSEAISTVTAGNIFTRMDGFSYYVFFSSCLIKICLCLKLSAGLVKKAVSLTLNKDK